MAATVITAGAIMVLGGSSLEVALSGPPAMDIVEWLAARAFHFWNPARLIV